MDTSSYYKTIISVSIVAFLSGFTMVGRGLLYAEEERVSMLKPYESRAMISLESIPISDDEEMAMMGVLIEWDKSWAKVGYLGIGGYGALLGERGGFFTAGVTPGLRLLWKEWLLVDVGVFLGGGGGASAFPGSGLMIRSHGYVGVQVQGWRYVMGLSSQSISQVPISSTWVIGLSRPFYGLKLTHSQPARRQLDVSEIEPISMAVELGGTLYHPLGYIKRKDKTPFDGAVPLLSARIHRQLSQQITGLFELSAAYGNGADGYGCILAGIGQSVEVGSRVILFPHAMIGMSGGGNIDTGGGLTIQPGIDLQWTMTHSLGLVSRLAWMYAPTGSFQSWVYTVATTIPLSTLRPKSTVPDAIETSIIVPESMIRTRGYQWFVGTKHIWPAINKTLKSGDEYESVLDFFECGLAIPLRSWLDARIQTYWAYDGGIGAYGEGLIGLDVHTRSERGWGISGDVLIGAHGGGGVQVDNSALMQMTLTASIRPVYRIGVDVSYIYQRSLSDRGFEGSGIGFRIRKQTKWVHSLELDTQ